MREGFDDFMERKRQRARRRLGVAPGAHCSFPNCAEADPLALSVSTDDLLCYEHQALQQNRSIVEKHHPATKKIECSLTVPTLGNDHRVVTVMSERWTDEIESATSSASRKDMARLLGLFDVVRQLVGKYEKSLARLRLVIIWLDRTRTGWEKEFERWRDSRDARDP